MRITAALVAALVVTATMLLTLRLARARITAVTAGLLAATVGASPFIESFTLSGELLASLPAVLSLLAFCAYLRSGRSRWLVAAGLLTGVAVLVKQSAFDGGLAAVAYLLWTRRRDGLLPAGLLVGAALAPVALAAASAASVHDWWYAVVGYRLHADSLLTGSLGGRAHQFWATVPPAAKALALLAGLAAAGWRRAPLLARLWVGAAVLGVLGGGNFHAHYYIQLVPPLSLLAAVGLGRIWESGRRRVVALAVVGAAASVGLALPLALASPEKQARDIWPADPHLVHDAELASYVRTHTRAREQVLALWADADFYYLADRRPGVRYLWARNIATIPGALASVQRAIATRRPSLIVAVQSPATLDPSGRTEQLLDRWYRPEASVAGVPVYRSRSQRKTSAITSPTAAR
jgi:4-amino-4-deoxy-L-arabinose transferase-like glycosyltransferase